MKVKFTPSARAQFLAALAYVAADNATAARRVRARVEKVLLHLLSYPNSGRRLPEFPALPHRELIVAPFRLFYRLNGDVLWVVALWHSAQYPRAPSET
jgi:plasmid stabilization system protein ParE